VKRYVAEPGTDVVRDAMQSADGWFMCRHGFVETVRAVGLAAGRRATGAFRNEWLSFGIVEVDQQLVERAAELALKRGLHSLDSLHLAAALVLPNEGFCWDRRLHAAAADEGLRLLPEALS